MYTIIMRRLGAVLSTIPREPRLESNEFAAADSKNPCQIPIHSARDLTTTLAAPALLLIAILFSLLKFPLIYLFFEGEGGERFFGKKQI